MFVKLELYGNQNWLWKATSIWRLRPETRKWTSWPWYPLRHSQLRSDFVGIRVLNSDIHTLETCQRVWSKNEFEVWEGCWRERDPAEAGYQIQGMTGLSWQHTIDGGSNSDSRHKPDIETETWSQHPATDPYDPSRLRHRHLKRESISTKLGFITRVKPRFLTAYEKLPVFIR